MTRILFGLFSIYGWTSTFPRMSLSLVSTLGAYLEISSMSNCDPPLIIMMIIQTCNISPFIGLPTFLCPHAIIRIMSVLMTPKALYLRQISISISSFRSLPAALHALPLIIPTTSSVFVSYLLFMWTCT